MPKRAAPHDPTVQLLGRLDVFADATPAELHKLAVAAEERDYSANTDVIREGRIPTHFYAVSSGSLDVWSKGESGDERKINSLTEGDHFGEIGLVEGMPSTATVKTTTACTLIRVPAAVFLGLLSDAPRLMQLLLERVAGGLARSHPSYRLAAEDLGAASVTDLIDDTRARFERLSARDRARFISGIRALIDGSS
jgi:CRP-like cAMP-binding protein